MFLIILSKLFSKKDNCYFTTFIDDETHQIVLYLENNHIEKNFSIIKINLIILIISRKMKNKKNLKKNLISEHSTFTSQKFVEIVFYKVSNQKPDKCIYYYKYR